MLAYPGVMLFQHTQMGGLVFCRDSAFPSVSSLASLPVQQASERGVLPCDGGTGELAPGGPDALCDVDRGCYCPRLEDAFRMGYGLPMIRLVMDRIT